MKNKVKIGHKEYEIKYVDKIKKKYLRGVGSNHGSVKFIKEHTQGLCNSDKKRILIKKYKDGEKFLSYLTGNKQCEDDILFHELTHAVMNELHDENPKFERKLRQLYKDEIFIEELSRILKGMFVLK